MLRATSIILGLGMLFFSCTDESIQGSYPIMEIGIEQIEFGSVAIGKTPSREVVIQNRGVNDLILQEPAVWENPDAAFWVADYDQVIAPGTEGILEVVFGPTDIKRYESTLVIKGNDPDNPSVQIPLGGEGYRMGAIEVGAGDLVVTGIQLSPASDPDFEILGSTQTPAEVPAGTEVPLTLAYRPGLESLTGPVRERALEYLQNAPPQIATPVRRSAVYLLDASR